MDRRLMGYRGFFFPTSFHGNGGACKQQYISNKSEQRVENVTLFRCCCCCCCRAGGVQSFKMGLCKWHLIIFWYKFVFICGRRSGGGWTGRPIAWRLPESAGGWWIRRNCWAMGTACSSWDWGDWPCSRGGGGFRCCCSRPSPSPEWPYCAWQGVVAAAAVDVVAAAAVDDVVLLLLPLLVTRYRVDGPLGPDLRWTANGRNDGPFSALDWFASQVDCCRTRSCCSPCCSLLLRRLRRRHRRNSNCWPLRSRLPVQAAEATYCCPRTENSYRHPDVALLTWFLLPRLRSSDILYINITFYIYIYAVLS